MKNGHFRDERKGHRDDQVDDKISHPLRYVEEFEAMSAPTYGRIVTHCVVDEHEVEASRNGHKQRVERNARTPSHHVPVEINCHINDNRKQFVRKDQNLTAKQYEQFNNLQLSATLVDDHQRQHVRKVRYNVK